MKRRLTVEFDRCLADELEALAESQSGPEGRVSVSRIVRTACVQFLKGRTST